MLVVKGVLANPFGNPIAEAVIRFTAIVAEGSVLKGVDAECVTTKEGEYEFNLQYGRYRLEVLHEDEFHESGLILVDENLPSPITITSLVLYARPYEPPLLNPDKPVWDELYKDVLGSDEWERQAEEQVRDGDVLVNEDKSIHKNGDAYLAKETHTTGIENTIQSTQTLTYKDEYAQEASVSTSKNSTRNSSTVESLGSYTYSDGSTEAEKRVELIGSIGSTTQVMTEDKDTLDKVKGIQSTHVEESAGSTTATYKHGENQVSTTTAVKYMDADKFVQALIEQNVKLTYSNNGFPVEAFNRLLVNPEGSVNTLQVDKHIIQAVDGFPVATFDTANREITFDSKLTFKNTDDFIGEDGWSYDWDFEYSNDQVVWKPEYVFGDLWRKERKFRFKEYDPAGTKQYIGDAIIIIQLNGRDGVDGDNYYLEYEYTTAESYPSGWRPTFISGDDWRRWRSVRITPTGTELSKWQEEPMKGTDGPEGWVPEYQMFYGPDATKPLYSDADYDGSLDDINLSHWHQNMSSGDLYKYERRVWWKTRADFEKSRKDTTMVPHVMEPWSGPAKIMPVAGEDYGDRFAQLFLYKRAATKPSDAIGTWRYNFDTVTLEPIDGNYHGWSTSVVDGLEFLWVATATAHSLSNVDSDIDNWDVDKLTSNGVKTAVGYLYQVTASSVTSVALPTSTTSYSFTTGLVTGSLGSWKSVPPNSGKGTKLWRTFAPVTAEAFTVNEPIAANDWEVATVMAESGVDGSDGTNGYNNTLVYLYQRASSTPSKPSTVSTYNFSTKTLTGFNNGWSTSVPSGTAPLYVTGATASSIGLTDTIEASEWATPVIMAQNGVGITGVVNYYAKSSSATAAPTSWATTVPTLDATNKYLWNYEKVTSSDGSSIDSVPAVIGTMSVDGVGIKSVVEYYLASTSSSGVTTNTAGWTTAIQTTDTSKRYLWNYEVTTYTDNSTTTTAPVIIGTHGATGANGINGSNGLDGLNGASIFLYQRTTATPAVPSTTCTYTFSTGVLTGVNNGWVQNIPAGTTPLWVTTATAISNTATDTITPSEWAAPVIMAQSGVDGKHGAGSYVVTVANQTSIPNDAGKDNHILQLSGRAAQSADILTYKDDAKTFSKSYLRGASTWSEFQFVFDGSAIVNGTLAAEALKAGTTITDELYISSTKSKTEMTLSGAGDYRIWSGNTNPVLASFSVDRWGNTKINNLVGTSFRGGDLWIGENPNGQFGAYGKMWNAGITGDGKIHGSNVYFSGGSFTGTVNANAGTFNNVTIAENCNVLGTVYAERIVGDITKMFTYRDAFTVPAYSRARNLVLVQGGVVFRRRVSGMGTIGLNLHVYLNGSLVETRTTTANLPTGGNLDLEVTVQPFMTLPPNANTTITFATSAYGNGSLTGPEYNITARAVWLLALT